MVQVLLSRYLKKEIGIGHSQLKLIPSTYKFSHSHGGSLRNFRNGRKQRPLTSKDPVHLVLKCHRLTLREKSFRGRRSFSMIHFLIQKYSMKFYIKVEQLSIQGDHVHLLIRGTRRSHYQSFFRVLSGQIAQVFRTEGLLNRSTKVVSVNTTDSSTGAGERKSVTDTLGHHDSKSNKDNRSKLNTTKLWKYRPFTRVVKSWLGLKTLRNYIQLNEQEARGHIMYKKERLRGFSSGEWDVLWN